MKKKILILGNSAKEYALAKVFSEKYEVFVIPGNDAMKEFATCVDIRENSVMEILDFAIENDIGMTIPVSTKSQDTNITDLFKKNNLQIFAPDKNAVKLITDKAYAKKTLYKLKVPTPKFGIFEKQSMVNDYIKNQNCPFVIKTNEPSSAIIFASAKSSKTIVDSLFAQNNQKVIVEDYIYGDPFCFYAITDGYKALPIGSSVIYKHSLEGNGGQLTQGMGSCVPNNKLSFDNENFLINCVIYPTLEYLENNGSAYLGIIGINGIMADNGSVSILGYQSFMQDCDCASILSTINCDLYNLFESCIIGSFSDEVTDIPYNNSSSATIVLQCRNMDNNENIINGLENIDEDITVSYFNNTVKNKYLEFEAKSGTVLALTANGRTLSSAVTKAYNEAKNINFKGIHYRKDIGIPINTEF